MAYLAILAKIQTQTLDNVKQIEAAQISTLQTIREVGASLPSLINLQNVPTIEGLPTLAQVLEQNSSFATQLLEQEKAFASQLADVFSRVVKIKSSSN